MKILQYPRNKINYYNQIQLDLIENQQNLSEFIGLPFSEKSIQEQITLKIKEYSNHHRVVLNSVLIEQYKGTETTPEVIENIKRLKQDNTFTITTGHQLTLFGGPAYFFYKIIHAISLSKSLNDKFTDYHFVPVFWMASEDHDKDEISETTIFNDQFKWESDNAGPTGAFKLDRNFEEIKLRFIELFSNAEYDSVKKHIESFDGKNLSESFFKYLNSIFKKYGLIILEPNNSVLKNFLIPILENELENFTSYHKVNKTNEELSSRNIPVQAKVQLVNFFYLSENKRSKIYFVDNLFQIESKKYSKSELIELIRRNPENFSPNVFLRPLYQELILPNIAYIGGPGELSYWIQLKGIFSFYQVTYPLLTNRISVFFIDKNLKKKIDKFNFELLDYINQSFEILKQEFLEKESTFQKIDWTSIDDKFLDIYKESKQVFLVHSTEVIKSFEAEWKIIEKSFGNIKHKLEKQLNSKHEIALNQLRQIKQSLIPNSIPQEREIHFFQFCSNGSTNLINFLLEHIDPLNTNVFFIIQD